MFHCGTVILLCQCYSIKKKKIETLCNPKKKYQISIPLSMYPSLCLKSLLISVVFLVSNVFRERRLTPISPSYSDPFLSSYMYFEVRRNPYLDHMISIQPKLSFRNVRFYVQRQDCPLVKVK